MAWAGCQADPPCVIQPRPLAAIPLPPQWDGPAKGRKAAAVPASNSLYIDQDWWGKAGPMTRLWTLFHEVGHLEGARCEPCADRRSGEWCRQLGVKDDSSALSAIGRTLQFRSPEKAKAAFHAGFQQLGLDTSVYSQQQVTGYRNGVPQQLTLYEVRPGAWVSGDSLPDWEALFTAAEAQGLGYSVTSSFRLMGQNDDNASSTPPDPTFGSSQIGLWNQRMNPPFPGNPIPYQRGTVNATGAQLGEVAYPGWSEHQRGTALDLSFSNAQDYDTFAILGEQHNIYRDATGERWHYGWGGRRKVDIPGDPLGNLAADAINALHHRNIQLLLFVLVMLAAWEWGD